MLSTITLALSLLIAINFLLLRFSCNKITKKSTKKNVVKSKTIIKPIAKKSETAPLSPTGS